MLPLATPRKPFFAPATTVRTVTTLTELVKEAKKGRKKESKRGEGDGHGRLNFLARCPTARGEDAQLEAAINIVVFIRCAETAKEDNVLGFSTFWVSGLEVLFFNVVKPQVLPAHVLVKLFTENGLVRNNKSQSQIRLTLMEFWRAIQVCGKN